jgi:hypothetical protein
MRCGLGALGIVFESVSVGLQLRVYKSLDSDSWLLRSYTVLCSHSVSSQVSLLLFSCVACCNATILHCALLTQCFFTGELIVVLVCCVL